MRNVTMSALVLLFMANVSFGQSKTTSENLTVKIYDQQNQIISNEAYEGDEAKAIDVPALLLANQDAARITVRGLFYTDKEVNKISFDSNNVPEFAEAENFCENTEFTMKPFFGVGVYSTDDMRGVSVERVVESGPAQSAGIEMNEVIIAFNSLPVGSHCELKLEVAETDVGQVVPVQIEEGNRVRTDYVTIGGQINNKIDYVACDVVKAELPSTPVVDNSSINLSVYPNPTDGLTNLRFLSSSAEPIKFYVLDINGGILSKEVLNNFDGRLNLDYTFSDEAPGTYLFVIEQGDKLFKQQVIYTQK